MRYDIADARETVLKQGEWFIALAVSPDGTQLAYLKSVRTDEERRKKEYPSIVEVMPASGGASRVILRDPIWLTGHRYNTLAWTPDGRSLMFVRDDGLLWHAPVGGGEPQQMGISITGRLKGPSIHPDGKRIVFSVGQADDNELWALENFLPGLEELTRRIPHASLTKNVTLAPPNADLPRVECSGDRLARRAHPGHSSGAGPLHAGPGGQPDH